VIVQVVTLFPELFDSFKATSLVGRAATGGQLELVLRSPRDFGLGKHKSVDDTPYGGGSGMLMRVDVLVACMESFEPRAHQLLLTPQGRPFDQNKAIELAGLPAIMLVCGRYEGFDERVRKYVDEEVSLGDFVMTGGEVAAMAIIEAVVRLLPGVLGNEASTHEESHSPGNAGLLEYPHYTRPAEFRGDGVPPELLSGNHAEIAAWRASQARQRTEARRPDIAQKKPKT
jgi:tRNA (guanine37-N1)-methyltransferase